MLGDANPDLVLRGDDVVPRFGQAETVVDEAVLTVGGSGAIVACGAARLGLRVALCAIVGDDPFGGFMRTELSERGVDPEGLRTDPGRPTGLTVVLSGRGDRAILTSLGTIGDLDGASVDRGLLREARHVHVSSFFLQKRLAPDVPALFEEARAAGATTSLDPNWDPAEAWDGALGQALLHTDVFLPNAAEATRIAGEPDLEAAARSLARRVRLVVIKDGANGALAARGSEVIRRPATAMEEVVDTTGAGDSFDAGLLSSWLAGDALERALDIANVCGALSTRAAGGIGAQPTLDEVARRLAEPRTQAEA